MRRTNLLVSCLALLCCAVGLFAATATAGDRDKMPITTKSEQALKNYLQGRDLFDKLRIQEAREFYRKSVGADPDFALGHLALCQTAATNKDFFEEFDKARALANRVSDAERFWILGFEAGAIRGDPMTQREYFTKLVELYPNDERAHNLLAGNYFGQLDYPHAVAHYEKATKVNPSFSQPYNQMGYAYRFMRQYDKAEAVFKRYIELIPDDPNPYDSYAELLMKVGRFDESIDNYRKALKVNPTFIASHLGIATDLCFKGDHNAAREQLQLLYKNALDDGQRRGALTATAVTYIDEGKYDDALEQIRKQYTIAEAIHDTSAMSGDHNLMGNILFEAGRLKEAQDHYDRNLTMVESSSQLQGVKDQAWLLHLFNSARVQCAMGNTDEAKSMADEYLARVSAVKNTFQIKLAHQLKGSIALKGGNYENARKELIQSNLLNPQNIYRLAQAYEGLKQSDKAKEQYEQAAHYNVVSNINLAFIRNKAADKLGMM